MKRRTFSAGDLWAVPRVGAPVPAADGSMIVVPVTTTDMERNETATRLWLVPTSARDAGSGRKSDSARPLTGVEGSSSDPAFAPDGSRVAFVRKPPAAQDGKEPAPQHSDAPQLYVISTGGGEAVRMTDMPFGVAAPRWLPDGRRIVFLSQVYAGAEDVSRTAQMKEERDQDPVQVHVTEDRFYRYWDRWMTDGKVHHAFVLDTVSGDILDLMPSWRRILDPMDPGSSYALSPDGRELAFSSLRSEPPYDTLLWSVFRVRIPARVRQGQKPAPIREVSKGHGGNAVRPVYSPDGRWLVYGVQEVPHYYADKVRIAVYDRKSRAETILTESWDASAEQWIFGSDPSRLFIRAGVEARSRVFALDLTRALSKRRGGLPKEIAAGGTFGPLSAAEGDVVTTASSLTSPPEVIRIDGKTGRSERVTRFTAKATSGLSLSRVREMWFDGAGGDRVQMFVLFPPGEKPPAKGARGRGRKRWPLVHMIHGGPHGTFGDEWHWRWNPQAFAAPGYVVALVNFHGSTTFGQEFTDSIHGRWGDQPFTDVMAATDHLLDQGFVDGKRMAVTGGSYGGYLVSWIAARTKRFQCIVNHAGVCDFQTQYATDVTHGRARALGGEPWEGLEEMDAYNPLRHAEGFTSPMLVIHGGRDYRVPSDQGLEIYNVYKAKGLPARLVYYPGENHWILSPRNSLHWYGEVLGWLDRWVGNP